MPFTSLPIPKRFQYNNSDVGTEHNKSGFLLDWKPSSGITHSMMNPGHLVSAHEGQWTSCTWILIAFHIIRKYYQPPISGCECILWEPSKKGIFHLNTKYWAGLATNFNNTNADFSLLKTKTVRYPLDNKTDIEEEIFISRISRN